jgi:hypothetical protein
MTLELINLQRLLYSAITAPAGEAGGSAIGILPEVIRGDGRLSAHERIAIYADAYFYRLLDCLKEDFPATLAVVGAEEFRDLVRSYLTRHPPTEPSIFYAGRHLAHFLRGHRIRERWPFVADLACLERAVIEVFHGADAKVLLAGEMRSVGPAEWPELPVRTIPALQMFACEWRVGDVRRAVECGTAPGEPAHTPATLLVWRQGIEVYYRELEAPEYAALEVASKGANFAAVFEAFASQADVEDAPAQISRMLTRWLSDGLLIRA